MVKGISRQVIVVHSPDKKLFEQAIFILKDEAVGQEGITDEDLMKEAQKLLGTGRKGKRLLHWGPAWACGGALITGAVWLLTLLI